MIDKVLLYEVPDVDTFTTVVQQLIGIKFLYKGSKGYFPWGETNTVAPKVIKIRTGEKVMGLKALAIE